MMKTSFADNLSPISSLSGFLRLWSARHLHRQLAHLLLPALFLCFTLLSLTTFIKIAIQPVKAQSIADGFGGFSQQNSNEPIDIAADSLEIFDRKKIAVFTGSVKARQGKFELLAKKLKVTYAGSLGGQKKKDATPAASQGIKQIDATGKVAISTADNQSATSDWANFNVLTRVITIGGNVVLSEGGNVMRGDKLVIDLNTGVSKLDSKLNVAKTKKGKKPRIRAVFLPGKNGKSPFGSTKKNTQKTTVKPSNTPALPQKKGGLSRQN